jgi:hypothetical protein
MTPDRSGSIMFRVGHRDLPVDNRVALPTPHPKCQLGTLIDAISSEIERPVPATVATANRAWRKHLMTQNGPYAGPPPQPWSGGDSDEPYTEPADPWGEQATVEPAWGAHPTSMPPAMDSSAGYQSSQGFASALSPTSPAWGQPPAPSKRRNTPIVALVVVLGLLICGGLGTTAWLIKQRGDSASGSAAPVVPSVAPTDDGSVPRAQTSEDARFVAKGQCVRNEGTTAKPEMKIVACASGTFEVLKRVDGRTTGETDAESKCAKVTTYTKWYFYDSELDSLDFVLCLRER